MWIRRLCIGVGLLCLLPSMEPRVHAQPDSVRTAVLQAKGFSPDHSPRGALWRAAAVPGWGQFYNHQYYKIPFVYAGLAGLAYAIYKTNQDYLLYRHAAIFARGRALENRGQEIPDVISDWKTFKDDYRTVVREAGGNTNNLSSLPLRASQLRRTRDKFRRWRDLSIVGTGLFYALTIVDAYISAHLLTFNVGDDLALDVRPVGAAHALLRGRAQGGEPSALPPTAQQRAGLRVRIRF